MSDASPPPHEPDVGSSAWARLAELPLVVDGCRLEPLAAQTAGGWIRHTTVVRLSGARQQGEGEDVTYDETEQRRFQTRSDMPPLAGTWTLATFCAHLDDVLAADDATDASFRRWAHESAALDLALRQARRSLPAVLGRTPRPVTFVASLGLGEPPDPLRLDDFAMRAPGMRFKVDFANDWTRRTVEQLAERAGSIAIVDYKGCYRGAFRGPDADAAMYRQIADALPDAWLEDPELNATTDPCLAPHRDRITWDAPLHSRSDLDELAFPPRCINVKPSRFGTLRELFAVYAHCEAHGIAMYGGGQFELGPGRRQIQRLASLFHPDAPNDVAPSGYNRVPLPERLPASPLTPSFDP